MKTTKAILLVGLVVGIGTIVGVVLVERQAARATASQSAKAPLAADRNQSVSMAVSAMAPADPQPLPSEAPAAASDSVSKAPLATAEAQTKVQTPKTPAKTVQAPPASTGSQAPPTKAEIMDPMARSALSFVGADPDADEYWIGAINDPRLSADERQNLIEDLNEDGISDPQHPTVEDLPLIVNRLMLIESLASDAIDQVNADAFQEAYKDLANMYVSLMAGM